MTEIAFLRTVPLLQGLEDRDLEAIRAGSRVVRYGEGALILEEGGPNEAFHIVALGRVRVTRRVEDKEVPLGELAVGQTFGEMSILGDSIATATIRAVPATEILSLSADDLSRILLDTPQAAARFWYAVARDLRDRLVQTNDVVRSYFEVNRALVENPTFREVYAMCIR